MTLQSLPRTLIELRGVSRDISGSKDKAKRLLKNVTWRLRQGQRVGVIAGSMQEAHTFLDCAAGIASPQQGEVSIQANVSWPLG